MSISFLLNACVSARVRPCLCAYLSAFVWACECLRGRVCLCGRVCPRGRMCPRERVSAWACMSSWVCVHGRGRVCLRWRVSVSVSKI